MRAYVSMTVAFERFFAALRQYWRRLIVGAFIGWIVSSVGGAFVLAFFLPNLDLGTSNMLGAAIVWTGVGVGAIGAYALRPGETAEG